VPKVGRNEPCPCGSGRKYKACHLDSPGEIGSVEAAKAFLHKLDAWLSQPNMHNAGDEVLREIGAPAPAGGDGADRGDGVDPMVADIVLFDRGGLRQFLDVRGALLPGAERALALTWLLSRRSLHEVQAVRPGTSLTLRNLRSDGGIVEVADRSISGQVQPLDLLCLRLLPDDVGGVVASDGVLVPRLQRRHGLAAPAGPVAAGSWIPRASAPFLESQNGANEHPGPAGAGEAITTTAVRGLRRSCHPAATFAWL
jgi:hypothetical protein